MMEARDLLRATDILDWMAEHYAAATDREGAEKAALIRATQTLCLELAHELLKQEADKP
jgi:hypothetical protein